MKRSSFYVLFFVIAIGVLCQGCTGGAIEFAEASINSGNVADLDEATKKLLRYNADNPESAKGHETLARVYMKLRYNAQAKTRSGVQMKFNYDALAKTRYDAQMKAHYGTQAKLNFRVMIKNGGSPAVVLAEYQKLIGNLVNTTKPNYDLAFKFVGDIASILRDKHPNEATSEYIKLGDHAANNNYPGMAVRCYNTAEKSKPTEDQRQKIGNGYLRLAEMGFQTNRMKQLAIPLVGEK